MEWSGVEWVVHPDSSPVARASRADVQLITLLPPNTLVIEP